MRTKETWWEFSEIAGSPHFTLPPPPQTYLYSQPPAGGGKTRTLPHCYHTNFTASPLSDSWHTRCKVSYCHIPGIRASQAPGKASPAAPPFLSCDSPVIWSLGTQFQDLRGGAFAVDRLTQIDIDWCYLASVFVTSFLDNLELWTKSSRVAAPLHHFI